MNFPPFYAVSCVFVGLSAFLLTPQNAQAGLKCQNQKPSLSFSSVTAPTRYVRVISSKNLTQMHGGAGGSVVGGLGGGEIGFNAKSQFTVTQLGNQACINLRKVAVDFYTKPVIHIASNFSRTSCEYNAVMAHEKKHVSTLVKFVREYKPKAHYEITRLLESTQSAYGPIPISQVEAAQQAIQASLSAKIQDYNNRIMPVLQKRQQIIDTPQEYARVAAQCQNWDQKLMQE
ncbi:MAG: hypothetical protein IT559_07710 [Alphaproteobacteria bacterium]|nr:hypothetical protein [Alphaproteobacteria bacterium]